MDYSIISFLEVVFDDTASQAHYHFWPILLVSLLPRGPAKCLWQRWMEWSSGKSSQGKTENRSSAYDEKRKNFPHERTLRLTLIKFGSTFSLFFGTKIFRNCSAGQVLLQFISIGVFHKAGTLTMTSVQWPPPPVVGQTLLPTKPWRLFSDVSPVTIFCRIFF